MIQKAKQRQTEKGVSIQDALKQIEQEDLDERKKCIDNFERAVEERNSLNLDLALTAFQDQAEKSFQYNLVSKQDQMENAQILQKQQEDNKSDSEEEFDDLEKEDKEYKEKNKDVLEGFLQRYLQGKGKIYTKIPKQQIKNQNT